MNSAARKSSLAGDACARLVLVLALWVCAVPAVAEYIPPKGLVDSRIRVAPYNSEQVYRLRGFVGYQIDLEFEPGETFVGLGSGDIEGLSFVAQDNHLFLKPKAARVATNLTVLTSRRHYQLDYTAVAYRPGAYEAESIYSLRFSYQSPTPQTQADMEARKISADLTSASLDRAHNVDYWYCGGPALKPLSASDDGVHTRLRFGANAELPAIFVRNEDGSESLINFSMDEGDVIVHRLARRFILRRGRITGCIVNQGFTGGGTRLNTGTVSPQVDRKVQGGVP